MLDSSIWTLEVDLGGSRSSTCDKSVSKMLWGNIACPCMNGPTVSSHVSFASWVTQLTQIQLCKPQPRRYAPPRKRQGFGGFSTVQLAYELAYLPSLLRMAQCTHVIRLRSLGFLPKKCCKLKLSLTPNWRWWRFLGQVDASCLDDNCYVMCFVEQPVEKMIRWPVEKTVGGKKNGKEAPASKKKEYDKERVWLKAKRQKVFKRNNMTKQTSRIHHFR